MAFVPSQLGAAAPTHADFCLIIQADRLLARIDPAQRVVLPDREALTHWLVSTPEPSHLGQLDEQPCWFHAVDDANLAPPADWEWHETRSLLGAFTPTQLHAVSCARELHWWQTRNRFCGCCGTPTINLVEERAKKCPKCNALFFPGASCAVIVAVTRGDQLLLAHNRNFRPGLFSLLAGFVDPGETLEQAAIREVREEVGIEIGDLHYITSQPWPFPNSLMLGFNAAHRSGEVLVDGKEIEQAGWYSREVLPEIPRPGTVAHLLIDRWLRARP
jgi:NAD+ diphosphatase